MDPSVPYMNSVKKLHAMLDAVVKAGVPETFTHEFLRDLGFGSSYDRALIRVFRYLGMLDSSNRPQNPYRQFVDHTRSRAVLADRLRAAFDDLFRADKNAHAKTSTQLIGWFKSKTGSGEAVAKKIAATFKSLADYADFSKASAAALEAKPKEKPPEPMKKSKTPEEAILQPTGFGLVNRFEIHLPDTQNVETFRAIFRALREELMR